MAKQQLQRGTKSKMENKMKKKLILKNENGMGMDKIEYKLVRIYPLVIMEYNFKN